MPIEEKLSADEEKFFATEGDHVPESEERPEPPKEEVADEKIETKKDPAEKKEADLAQENKTVPLAALQEERKARKDAEERQRKNEENAQKRLDLIAQTMAANKPKPPEQQAPDLEKDPLGVVKLNQDQLRELFEFKKSFEDNQRQYAEREVLKNESIRLENEFVKDHPDYFQAGDFLKQSRMNELAASGYQPHQITQIIQQETWALAQQALQGGRNPAESVMAIAMARGYKKAETKVEETEADKLARIAAGQKTGKSLSQAAGGALPGAGQKLDAKTLANMTDDEFEKIYSKLSKGDMHALFGD